MCVRARVRARVRVRVRVCECVYGCSITDQLAAVVPPMLALSTLMPPETPTTLATGLTSMSLHKTTETLLVVSNLLVAICSAITQRSFCLQLGTFDHVSSPFLIKVNVV